MCRRHAKHAIEASRNRRNIGVCLAAKSTSKNTRGHTRPAQFRGDRIHEESYFLLVWAAEHKVSSFDRIPKATGLHDIFRNVIDLCIRVTIEDPLLLILYFQFSEICPPMRVLDEVKIFVAIWIEYYPTPHTVHCEVFIDWRPAATHSDLNDAFVAKILRREQVFDSIET